MLRSVPTSAAEPFTLPPLPYDMSALSPTISARTLEYHHDKHHKAYVQKLNDLVRDKSFSEMRLEDIITKTASDPARKDLFHNAAQAWNHTFYWSSLSPKASYPSRALVKAIERDFGSLDDLKAELATKATEHFASGWAWLVVQDKKLSILDTHDADNPLTRGGHCLLTIDVWEHAYYLDYENERKAYVKGVVDGLLNWHFASANFEEAEF
jgi:Fe-Mn family superoxide dismutase